MNTHKLRFFAITAVAAVALAVVGVVVTTHFGGGAGSSAIAAPAPAPAPKSETTPTSSDARALADQLSGLFESASNKIGPSVVPIFAVQSKEVASNDQLRQFFGDDFFRRFFGNPDLGQGGRQTVHSMGSGVIVSKDGYILTNNHVVSGADKLTVKLNNGDKVPAKVIGTDPQTDVAVIKVDAHDLPAANLGDSDKVRVGQWVIAVGNPFELLHSVTAGIISATGRSRVGLTAYEDFIQTDASINPGNSGGALADLDGNVIGINTAITSPSGASAGIGFAIPINMAKHVMDELISKGKVSRGYLALVPQDLNENLAQAMGTKTDGGALVGDVVPDGPASKAGIKRGDIITKFDGNNVKDSNDLRNQVANKAPDSKVQVEVLRDGKPLDLTVKLGERPANPAENSTGEEGNELSKGLGLELQDLTPGIASQLGLSKQKGALIVSVASGSAAEDAGLQRGDLIQEVDNHPVDSASACVRALKRASKKDSILLLVRRGSTTFFAAIKSS